QAINSRCVRSTPTGKRPSSMPSRPISGSGDKATGASAPCTTPPLPPSESKLRGRLQVRDDFFTYRRVVNALEWLHVVVGNHSLGIRDEPVERRLIPGDSRALEAPRIAGVPGRCCGLAADDLVESGSLAVVSRLGGMTRTAIVVERLGPGRRGGH